MDVYNAAQVETALLMLPDWRLQSGTLARDFVFGDFREAMSFVNTVAAMAERAGHHPDIDIRYNKVRLAVVSHDAGGITEKDFALAKEIEASLP